MAICFRVATMARNWPQQSERCWDNSMPDEIDDNERTNPVGLFNTARSYWQSAEHLNAAALKVAHPSAPVTFLFCHSIELYLKAYLRGSGRTIVELKRLGHRVADLSKAAAESGLKIGPEQSEILSHIDDADVAIEARYIVTGFKNLPTNKALSDVAGHLDKAACDILAEQGFAVRRELFKAAEPRRPDDLAPDTARVLVRLFEAQDGCSIGDLEVELNMEGAVVRYHLDRLEEANLAEATGSYGPLYWDLTSEGRRHVVERNLRS